MMEDMDFDQIIDIPDTPDRTAVRRINAGDCIGRGSKLSVAGHLRNSDCMDEGCLNQPRARGRPVGENRHSRSLHVHPWKNTSNVDTIEHRCNSIASSPLKNSNASRNVSLFRRTVIDKNSKHETMNSTGVQHIDKVKLACSNFPSVSSSFCEENARIDLAEHNGQERKLEMAFPLGKSKDLPAKELKEGQLAGQCGSSLPQKFPKTSGNSNKGKEKIGENTIKGTDSIMGHGKGINLSGGSQHNNEKKMSASRQSVLSPRFNGHKRLVRNGCISPHNIQIKAKQLAEHSQNCSKGAEEDPMRDMVSNGSCMIDIRDIVAEDNTSDRSKAIMTHPSNFKERHPKSISLSGSSAMSNDVNGNSQADGDALGCFEGLGGWRSTRYRPKKVDHSLCDATGLHSMRNGDVECFSFKEQSKDNLSGKNCGMEDQNVSRTASKLVLEPDQISEPRGVANTLTKRQRKHESTLRKHGESSRTVPDDSDIVFLGSSGESSRSRSSRIQSQQQQGILAVDEFIELSPEIRCSNSRGICGRDNDDLDAKARQLKADEMLARELQEQLYHDSPIFGGDEIDENIAWMLQQEENARPFSYQNHRVSHPRTTSMHSYRQPQSRLLENSLNRRGARSRVHTSSGVTQLRSRFLHRSRAAPSRARNLQFPLDMDLDMRIDILEALEAAVGDLSDEGTARHISQLQRDFNENDYEMLLALDDNNNQHGASDNQINSLPLSTVQTDNFEEACAVCLDTPAIGETIRHLPCLHKFHKACIDPWLSRRPSCPICKSSIT